MLRDLFGNPDAEYWVACCIGPLGLVRLRQTARWCSQDDVLNWELSPVARDWKVPHVALRQPRRDDVVEVQKWDAYNLCWSGPSRTGRVHIAVGAHSYEPVVVVFNGVQHDDVTSDDEEEVDPDDVVTVAGFPTYPTPLSFFSEGLSFEELATKFCLLLRHPEFDPSFEDNYLMRNMFGNWQSCLHMAAELGLTGIGRLLVTHRADLGTTWEITNGPEHNSCTPLAVAAYYEHAGFVQMLLQLKADPNAKIQQWDGCPFDFFWDGDSHREDTALTLACKKGQLQIVEMLLAHGASVDLMCLRVSDWTDWSWREFEVVELDGVVCTGQHNAVLVAAQHGHIDITRLLLQHRASVDFGYIHECSGFGSMQGSNWQGGNSWCTAAGAAANSEIRKLLEQPQPEVRQCSKASCETSRLDGAAFWKSNLDGAVFWKSSREGHDAIWYCSSCWDRMVKELFTLPHRRLDAS